MSKGNALVFVGIVTCCVMGGAGCFMFEESEAPHCEREVLWQCDTTGGHYGCENWSKTDCAAIDKTCREYDDTAACVYPEVECTAQAICDGDTNYLCNQAAGLAYSRTDCSATGRECVIYEDQEGANAGCFYSEIECENDEAGVEYSFCQDNFDYACNLDAKMAYKRTDCSEQNMGCVEFGENSAVCSPPCAVEDAEACDESKKTVLLCSDGYWVPQETCGRNRECVQYEDEDPHIAADCLEADCTDTEWQSTAYCDGDVWVSECGEERKETLCTAGCETFDEVDAGVRVLCEQDTDQE